ncbi:MAG: hypothetical protein A2583_08635 [Bdellovibrionales bacterium RIFOXYD1_FULL_53_11]|nr:MAG: hypothetical protein A2583_08635 [Bdellovibrionales bacterium RIFOXYD1_FULL_53_11]
MKKINLIGLSLFTAVLSAGATPGAGSASPATRVSCEDAKNRVQKLEDSLKKMQSIRDANVNFMARLDKSDTSKKIKVSSNIMIASIQIETISNNIAVLKKILNRCGG